MADKGGAVVLQDVEYYVAEGLRHVGNRQHYEERQEDPTIGIAKRSNAIARLLRKNGHLSHETLKWAIVEPKNVGCHRFYTLPKIHKSLTHPPGRPIVSGINGPTENLSKLVDHWLQSFVTRVPSYIKDTTFVLNMLQEWNHRFGPFDGDARLVTIDVVGLYTNIPHQDMYAALRHHLATRHPESIAPPTEDVITVVEHVLRNNVFTFEDKFYRQTCGMAMGSPMAPSIANLFMAWLEERMLNSSPVPVRDELWKRFIDDILLLWTGSEDDLQRFVDHINSFLPTIQLTVQSSTDSLSFLDTSISLKDGFLQTDLYTKPTDSHAYLHPRSCHPRHVTKGIVPGQFIRLKRLCSDPDVFEHRCNEMQSNFIRRGYDEALVREARQKVSLIPRSQTLQYKEKTNSERVPFVVNYHPSNPPLRQ